MRLASKQLALSLGVALVLLAGCARGPNPSASSGPPPAPVRVATAETKTLPVEIHAIGNVEAYNTISVKSQIGGTLMKVNFKEGDPVRQGQLLFEIDPRPYQEAIRQIEATLQRDEALSQQAEANLARDVAEEKYYRGQAERYLALAKQGVVSRQQADQTVSDADSRTAALKADKAAIESARSAMEADRASLSNAKLQLSYCSIYSPVEGRSGNISVKEGNLVKATDVELVTVTQVQPIYVTFTVPEKQLPAIRERMRSGNIRVRAIPQGGSAGDEGTLTFVNNMVDQTTATIKLKGTFANGASRLWPGQFVDVVLTLGRRPNLVTVPYKAVQVGQSGR